MTFYRRFLFFTLLAIFCYPAMGFAQYRFDTQPQNVETSEGAIGASFSAGVTGGTAPYSFTWETDGGDFCVTTTSNTAQSSTLTFSVITRSKYVASCGGSVNVAGRYRLKATDSYIDPVTSRSAPRTIFSNWATLSVDINRPLGIKQIYVNNQPVIKNTPEGRRFLHTFAGTVYVVEGRDVSFSVETGTPVNAPVSYSWSGCQEVDGKKVEKIGYSSSFSLNNITKICDGAIVNVKVADRDGDSDEGLPISVKVETDVVGQKIKELRAKPDYGYPNSSGIIDILEGDSAILAGSVTGYGQLLVEWAIPGSTSTNPKTGEVTITPPVVFHSETVGSGSCSTKPLPPKVSQAVKHTVGGQNRSKDGAKYQILVTDCYSKQAVARTLTLNIHYFDPFYNSDGDLAKLLHVPLLYPHTVELPTFEGLPSLMLCLATDGHNLNSVEWITDLAGTDVDAGGELEWAESRTSWGLMPLSNPPFIYGNFSTYFAPEMPRSLNGNTIRCRTKDVDWDWLYDERFVNLHIESAPTIQASSSRVAPGTKVTFKTKEIDHHYYIWYINGKTEFTSDTPVFTHSIYVDSVVTVKIANRLGEIPDELYPDGRPPKGAKNGFIEASTKVITGLSNKVCPDGAVLRGDKCIAGGFAIAPGDGRPDADGDGFADEAEKLFGSSPYDPGSYVEELRSPAYSLWNGHLGMINYLELVNIDSTTKGAFENEKSSVDLTLYKANGSVGFRGKYELSPGQQLDLSVSSMSGFETNKYGLIRLEFPQGKIMGRMFFYRQNANKGYDFAFGIALNNPVYGRSYVGFNTMDPANLGQLIANWLSIVNIQPESKSFIWNKFSSTGKLLLQKNITIPANGRVDLEAGHEIPGPGNVGVNEIIPLDGSSPYIAQLVRYGYNTKGGFDFAFPLVARPGNGELTLVPISSRFEGQNWIEVVNTRESKVSVDVTLVDKNGAPVGSWSGLVLNPFSQVHLPAHAHGLNDIGYDNIGTAIITPSIPNSVIVQSMFYFFGETGRVNAMYGSQFKEVHGNGQSYGSYNLYLHMESFLRLANTVSNQTTVGVRINNPKTVPLDLKVTIPANGAVEIPLHEYETYRTSKDTYGTIQITPSNDTGVLAEIIRVLKNPVTNQLEFVAPTDVR